MADLFGVESKEQVEKPIVFEFKSTKGSKVRISYQPSGSIKVSDKKAFEGHLKKVADLFEVVEKKEDKPKDLDVTETAKEGGETDE
jgi:hypothetical protein